MNNSCLLESLCSYLKTILPLFLGFLLSILCPSENDAMQATVGSFYPILLLSGILWPVEGMPYFFQAITWWVSLSRFYFSREVGEGIGIGTCVGMHSREVVEGVGVGTCEGIHFSR